MNSKLLFISITFFGIIALFLILEHRVHLYAFVPFAVFIIFIGLHLFMHMGMGHGEKHEHEKEK